MSMPFVFDIEYEIKLLLFILISLNIQAFLWKQGAYVVLVNVVELNFGMMNAILLNAVVLNVILLNGLMLKVIISNANLLNAVLLYVVLPNVVLLNVFPFNATLLNVVVPRPVSVCSLKLHCNCN